MRPSLLLRASGAGAVVAGFRVLGSLVLALLAKRWPEASMLLVIDVPTRLAYGMLGWFGFARDVTAPGDPTLVAIAALVWFGIGFFVTGLALFLARRKT